MDILIFGAIGLVAILFLLSPFMINQHYKEKIQYKPFSITNGICSMLGWGLLVGALVNFGDLSKVCDKSNLAIADCVSPLWNQGFDNELVFFALLLVSGLLFIGGVFRAIWRKTNIIVAGYLIIVMPFIMISVVGVLYLIVAGIKAEVRT